MIMSRMSTNMQNFVTIPQGFLFPVCAKLRIKDLLGFFFPGSSNIWPTAQAPEPIFTRNTSNDAVSRKDINNNNNNNNSNESISTAQNKNPQMRRLA